MYIYIYIIGSLTTVMILVVMNRVFFVNKVLQIKQHIFQTNRATEPTKRLYIQAN